MGASVTVGQGIRVGVVGLGAFGRHHVRHYGMNPDARLVAVADLDATRAAEHAAQSGAIALSDHRDMIGKVDAVSVTAISTQHYAIARDLIDAGIHVFVEKPLAVDQAGAEDLAARAAARGVILQVGHIERFSPAVMALQERVTDPRRISAVRTTPWHGRSSDVDVILDIMIHDIDIVLALVDAPVASVAGDGASSVTDHVDEAEAWITFANGAIATLSASRCAEAASRRLTVTEPGFAYVADLAGPSLAIARRGRRGVAEVVALEPRDALGAEIAAFLHSIASGDPPVVDGRAGAAALAIAERIQAAIAEGDVPARRSS